MREISHEEDKVMVFTGRWWIVIASQRFNFYLSIHTGRVVGSGFDKGKYDDGLFIKEGWVIHERKKI